MKEYQLRDYKIHISDRLFPVYNEEKEQIMVVYPDYSSVCVNIDFHHHDHLSIASFWGVVYEIKDKEIFIYYNDEELGEE